MLCCCLQVISGNGKSLISVGNHMQRNAFDLRGKLADAKDLVGEETVKLVCQSHSMPYLLTGCNPCWGIISAHMHSLKGPAMT